MEFTQEQFDEAIRLAKAAAWQEGRNSLAQDFLKPMNSSGFREISQNPYE